jgi:glycosyltransferase involved in cell wall biosynthesis
MSFMPNQKAFGHQQRKILSEQGSQNLKKKHTPEKFKAKVDAVKKTDQLDIVRTQIQDALRARSVNVSQIDLRTMRILFLLPVKGGSGGAHSVVQEVSEMRRLGIHAHIAMKHDQVDGFIRGYTDIPGSQDTFIGFDNDSLLDIAEDFDIVVGTIFNSMSLVQRVVEANPHILPAYYVQDYEPLFFEVDTPNWHLARDSYTLVPGACLFAKTQWIIDEVKSHHGVQVHKVEPSIDHEVYKLQSRSSSGGIQIAAMIRPQTPRRGAERTMRLLERLHGLLGDAIAVNLFGCPSDAPEFLRLSRNFAFVNHGLLSRTEVATLLGQSDIFIDLSDYQAFGRTALEGMASGCAAFVPAVGGAHEYARHDQTALIVDTTNEAACFEAVYALVTDPPRLKRLQRAGLKTAARYSVHAAAVSELLVLEKSLALWRSAHPRRDKGSLVIIPESTEPGVPTVTGYVRGILPYLTPAVRQLWKVSQAASLPHPGSANAVLIQRDAMGIHIDDLQAWLPNWRALGGKLIFELDDDLLTEAAMLRHPSKDNVASVVRKVRYLSQQADLVVTSTESLAHQLAGLNNNVKIIPTALDANLWQLDRPRIHTEGQFKRKPFEMVRIGYFGTNDQYADLEIVREAMRVIENKYGATVEIEVIGTFQNKKPLFGKRVGLPKKNDYPQFVNWLLQRVHWDIGILPQRNKYNDATSSLKFLEYTALDMAILTSDHEDVQSLAVPGQNCLVANDSVDSWVQQLSRLIEDSDLRSRLANCGREIFKSNYTNRSNEFFVSDYLRKLIS